MTQGGDFYANCRALYQRKVVPRCRRTSAPDDSLGACSAISLRGRSQRRRRGWRRTADRAWLNGGATPPAPVPAPAQQAERRRHAPADGAVGQRPIASDGMAAPRSGPSCSAPGRGSAGCDSVTRVSHPSTADRLRTTVSTAAESWIWPTFRDRVGSDGSCGEQDALAQQVEFGTAVHLSLDHFDAVHIALDRARAVGEGQSVEDGGVVAA